MRPSSSRACLRRYTLGISHFPSALVCAPDGIDSRRSTRARIPLCLRAPCAPPVFHRAINAQNADFRVFFLRQTRRPGIRITILYHDYFLWCACSRMDAHLWPDEKWDRRPIDGRGRKIVAVCFRRRPWWRSTGSSEAKMVLLLYLEGVFLSLDEV